MTVLSPRQAALASVQDFTASPTGIVEYRSMGNVLIIGGREALYAAAQMHPPLKPQVLLTTDSDLAKGKSIITLLGARNPQLSGWLGAFKLLLTDEAGTTTTLQADIVLDLGDAPLLTMEVTPPGYFSPAADTWVSALPAVITDISELTGTFAKPRYFDYNPSICAHSRSGLPGCNRCIEACPTDAIISIGEMIKVEPHLCQGGGTCGTVCPSGAIRYHYPSAGYHVDQTRRMLKAYREAGGTQPIILFYRSEIAGLLIENLPENILPVPVEELASVGAELWMAAVSFGASQVLLLDETITPHGSRRALQQQLAIVHAQLTSMGYPAAVVALLPPSDAAITLQIPADPGMPSIKPATQGGLDNKRQQWLLAVDHLHAQAPTPVSEIPLPAGAPFGRLKIDRDACTLCMACATICPAQAISGGVDSPQLRFFTVNCVQCGLCATGCPEQAITLEPVFVTDREVRNKPLLLNEERPFLCISCGKPFASQSMIRTMLGKLQGHYMFQNERAQNRLKMCEDCRVIDVVQDDEAMGAPQLGDKVTQLRLH